MKPPSLNERLDRLGQHIVRARLFLELWFYFEEEESRRPILGVMREYNEFFRFTPHAYFISYVIYISGVFDKAKGTNKIDDIIREAKKVGHLKGQDAVDLEALFGRATLLADKVKVLRDNAFAHQSAHISERPFEKEDSLGPASVIHTKDVDTTDARPHGRDRTEDEALSDRSHR